ncbi:MAG: N(4)-acetylcytidine aminohydrolase [Shewanella sp.]|nr:N(4)-acetylcytidine aminohydrolase [Shewanella sp.]MCF1430521.1 N(4)-acetylcytidine aminohydrolase [Shewanella sp.]MCF1439581.1 N(4)-acetylcytidine aminohydrolase [Shewanella sp.]MCF1457432.1 N(4)-acetylcytidine aminohydrolase [Shewanella sp.]
MSMDKITFFSRFKADILAGKKTITLRDEGESGVIAGQRLPVYTLEEERWFCDIHIIAVQEIEFDALSEKEAQQENMSLEQLKAVIQEIYPGIRQLYKISFELC